MPNQKKTCPRCGGEVFAECALCASYTPSESVLEKLIDDETKALLAQAEDRQRRGEIKIVPQLDAIREDASINVRANYMNTYRDCANRAVEMSRLMYDSEYCKH